MVHFYDLNDHNITNHTVGTNVQVPFEDGDWCIDFTVDLLDKLPGHLPQATNDVKACQQVVAEPCVVNAYTSVDSADGWLTWSSSYTLSDWCMDGEDYVDFQMQYRWQNGEWEDVSEHDYEFADWKNQLWTTGQFTYSEVRSPEDLEVEVRFAVNYNGDAFDTQSAAFSNASDSYSDVTVCHPSIAHGYPLIE